MNLETLLPAILAVVAGISTALVSLRRSRVDMQDSMMKWQEFQSNELERLRERLDEQEEEIAKLRLHIKAQDDMMAVQVTRIRRLFAAGVKNIEQLTAARIEPAVDLEKFKEIANGDAA